LIGSPHLGGGPAQVLGDRGAGRADPATDPDDRSEPRIQVASGPRTIAASTTQGRRSRRHRGRSTAVGYGGPGRQRRRQRHSRLEARSHEVDGKRNGKRIAGRRARGPKRSPAPTNSRLPSE